MYRTSTLTSTRSQTVYPAVEILIFEFEQVHAHRWTSPRPPRPGPRLPGCRAAPLTAPPPAAPVMLKRHLPHGVNALAAELAALVLPSRSGLVDDADKEIEQLTIVAGIFPKFCMGHLLNVLHTKKRGLSVRSIGPAGGSPCRNPGLSFCKSHSRYSSASSLGSSFLLARSLVSLMCLAY